MRANTPLDKYLSALGSLREAEMVLLAEEHAKAPGLLISRFLASVEAVERRSPIDEQFYENVRKTPPLVFTSPGRIKSTIEFAGYLSGGQLCSVKDAAFLNFRYIDREIFPARTRDKISSGPRRSLDLLLANSADHLPVLAELKIRHDKPVYYALVQVLMLAAEFQSRSQRDRLAKHPGCAGLKLSESGPFVDVYVIAFDPPKMGKYRDRLAAAAAPISEALADNEKVSCFIRRIVYLHATVAGDAIAFHKEFAFGPGC